MKIYFYLGYLSERKQLQSLPLSVLSDSRLGIDASNYLQSLLNGPPVREPLLAATGGQPLTLVTRIENDLRALEKLRIKPVFVFPGLIPHKKLKPHSMQHEYNDVCRERRDAWGKYENGQEEAATKLFEARNATIQWDLWRMVLRIFRHRNVEFIVAPYVSWAQVISTSSKFFLNIMIDGESCCCGFVFSIIANLPAKTFQSIRACYIRTDRDITLPRRRQTNNEH